MFEIEIDHKYTDHDKEESSYSVKVNGTTMVSRGEFDCINKVGEFVKHCIISYLVDTGKY